MIPVDVEVAPVTDREYTGFSVHPIWAGVDRPNTGGWVVRDKRMARRLEAAIRAGVVYSRTEIRTDVDGNTYVAVTSRVLGRYLNADLKRLGF
jgi:hypothetical protein